MSRADTELEPSKLSARDKTGLVWLWGLAFLYGMMTDQLVSKAECSTLIGREQFRYCALIG